MDIISFIVILFLSAIIIYRGFIIDDLKKEIDREKVRYNDLDKEYNYYINLSRTLWKMYREPELFPSKLARRIDEIGEWY